MDLAGIFSEAASQGPSPEVLHGLSKFQPQTDFDLDGVLFVIESLVDLAVQQQNVQSVCDILSAILSNPLLRSSIIMSQIDLSPLLRVRADGRLAELISAAQAAGWSGKSK